MNVRKLMLASMTTASIALTSTVFAADCGVTNVNSWYAGVLGGFSWAKNMSDTTAGYHGVAKFDKGSVWGVQVGRNIDQHWALEGQYLYIHSPIDKATENSAVINGGRGNFATQAGMLNGYYNFNTVNNVTPYIGLGLGAAKITPHVKSDSDSKLMHSSDTVLAYQGIVGISFQLTPNVGLGADYRYFQTERANFKYSSSNYKMGDKFTTQAVALSLKYSFA